MPLVAGVDGLDAAHRLARVAEAHDPLVGRQGVAQARVLQQGRPPRGEVAGRPVADPAALQRHVAVLRDAELRARAAHEGAVVLGRPRHDPAGAHLPAARDERLRVGAGQRQVEGLPRAPGQVGEPGEFAVLVSVAAAGVLDLAIAPPLEHGREVLGRPVAGRPRLERDGRQERLPAAPRRGDVAARRADGLADREERTAAIHRVTERGVAGEQADLGEARVGVHERPAPGLVVLGAPQVERTAAHQQEVRLSAAVAEALGRHAHPAVPRAVDPAVAQADRLQTPPHVVGGVAEVLGDPLGLPVVHPRARAGVLEVGDLAAELAQPQQVLHVHPGVAAHREAADAAGEDDPRAHRPAPEPDATRRSGRAGRASCRRWKRA